MVRSRVHPSKTKEIPSPLSSCILYCFICLLWIYTSDRLLAAAHLPIELTFWCATLKGVGFVLATGTLLYVLLKRDTDRLREAHDARLLSSLEIAHRLAYAIELRDVTCSEHNERIAGYCRCVGQALGLEINRLDMLVRVAPLHDVGKIAIPDYILQKPGPLSEEETQIVRKHARLGAELLRSDGNPFMTLASTVAGSHHEAWDGTGYPSGLKGEEIPLECRIVAVCDVFDALLSERPYKESWSFENAIGEIRRLSGSKFDPQVVSAFERAVPALRREHCEQTGSRFLEAFDAAPAAI